MRTPRESSSRAAQAPANKHAANVCRRSPGGTRTLTSRAARAGSRARRAGQSAGKIRKAYRPGALARADRSEYERPDTMSEHFSEEAWDERYRTREKLWSGKPNPLLVSEVEGLPPG